MPHFGIDIRSSGVFSAISDFLVEGLAHPSFALSIAGFGGVAVGGGGGVAGCEGAEVAGGDVLDVGDGEGGDFGLWGARVGGFVIGIDVGGGRDGDCFGREGEGGFDGVLEGGLWGSVG